MKIIIYTDGSALGNPGAGGYGIVLETEDKRNRKEMFGGFKRTTNNRMELLAVIVALETLKKHSEVIVFSDSKYVVDSVSKGWVLNWEKKGFKKRVNVDLWKRFLEIYKKHKVTFQWVKGHAGNIENEKADELAVRGAKSSTLLVDEGYEKQL